MIIITYSTEVSGKIINSRLVEMQKKYRTVERCTSSVWNLEQIVISSALLVSGW